MALEDTLGQAADVAATVSHGLEDQGDLVVVESRLEMIQKDEALRTMLEIGKAAGRVQSAQIFGHVADSIHVSQLRRLKEIHKTAGLTWAQACEIVGIARRTADRYLNLADELGDDFFGHCAQIGLSVRAMDAARQLPEPVRQALAQGEVVDLETVSKEALTDVIRQLANDHAKERAELERDLAAERKLGKKALDKAAKLSDERDALTQEVEALKEGLSGDDKRDLDRLRHVESTAMAFLVSVKNTLEVKGRDPVFRARLFSFLSLLQNMCDFTASVLQARLEGPEVEMEFYQSERGQAQEALTRGDNEDAAHHDQRAPYPGV